MALDLTKPVQTVDGRKVRVLCTDRVDDCGWTVIGLVAGQDGLERSYGFKPDGTSYLGNGGHLINVPEERFVIAHRHHTGVEYISGILKSRADAEVQLITYLAHGPAEIFRLVPA